jgi:release factor glutamine methyltransferase
VATSGELLEGAIGRLGASGSETPRLDAEVLLAYTLGIDRSTVLANPQAPVGPGAADRFEEAVTRREAGEPVAYIRGLKEFFGIVLAVDSRALIPRPETERLVEAVVRETMARLTAPGRSFEEEPVRIADVGTGSGAVAIAVAVELRRRQVPIASVIRILATDVRPDALNLARENAVAHAVADSLEFAVADLLPPDVEDRGRFDIVAANLPYVRSDVIATLPVAASFEPRTALDGGEDGLHVIRALLLRLPDVLADDGVALLEIGGDQGSDAPAAAGLALPGWSATVENDLGGLPRVLRVSR